MAEMNEIFTRLQLKHDTYANWMAVQDTFKPLAGEICIVEIPSTNSTITTTPPTVLFKVGMYKKDASGKDTAELYTFRELNWGSALAADVHAWAKKATPDWTDFPALPIEVIDEGTGKFVTGFTYAGNKLTITRSDVVWTDVKNAPDFALKTDLPTELGVMTVTGKDAIAATNGKNVEVSLKIADGEGKIGNITLSQSTDGLKAEYDLATELADFGISKDANGNKLAYVAKLGVSDEASISKLSVSGSATIQGEAIATKKYADDEIKKVTDTLGDLATKDTITKDEIDNFATEVAAVKVTNAGTADKVAHKFTVNGVEFDGSAEKSVTIDASTLGLASAMHFIGAYAIAPEKAFAGSDNERALANGDVYLNTANHTEYVYSEGKWVELGNEGSHALNTIKIEGKGYLTGGGDLTANREIDITAEAKTKIDNGATAYGWGDHAQEGYLKAADIANKADKVTSATAGNFAGLDENGNLTDSGKKAADFKTVQEAKDDYTGSTVKTVTSIKQNENGEITEVKFEDIGKITAAQNADVAKKLDNNTLTIENSIYWKDAGGGIDVTWRADDVRVTSGSSNTPANFAVQGWNAETQTYESTTITNGNITAKKITVDAATIDGVEIKSNDSISAVKYLVFNCGSATFLVD